MKSSFHPQPASRPSEFEAPGAVGPTNCHILPKVSLQWWSDDNDHDKKKQCRNETYIIVKQARMMSSWWCNKNYLQFLSDRSCNMFPSGYYVYCRRCRTVDHSATSWPQTHCPTTDRRRQSWMGTCWLEKSHGEFGESVWSLHPWRSLPYTMDVAVARGKFVAKLKTCLSEDEYVGSHQTEAHAKQKAAKSFSRERLSAGFFQ